MASWNKHFGTQRKVILDLVNKSWTNVAEMYFIGFGDPENISLCTKSIFMAGLEIKISCKMPFCQCLDTFLRGLPGLIFFSDIKIYQIRSRNLICLIWRRNFFFQGLLRITLVSSSNIHLHIQIQITLFSSYNKHLYGLHIRE